MILGIGVDIIEVERMADKMGRSESFGEMLFSKNEIEYCESKTYKYEHYAARFAAKEAFYKALGSGWKNETAFNEIEVTNDEKGKPFIILLGQTSRLIEQMGIKSIHVSLSHIRAMAVAYVIIEN